MTSQSMTSQSKRRRILYIITKAEFGGAQSHVIDLITHFQASHEVHLATGLEGFVSGSLKSVEALGVPIHHLPLLKRSINPRSDLAAASECGDLLRRIKPDLIHAHSSKAGVVARLAGRRAGIPTVFTAHGWGFSPGVPPVRRVVAWLTEKLIAPLSAKIICVSECDRRLALRRRVGKRSLLQTIRYGLPPEAPRARDVEQQPPRLLMVARFNEQKDQATLLRALVGLKNEAVHVDFIGTGPGFEEGKALAQSLGVADKVSFLGDRDDVPLLLAGAQAFVLSTHYEGLPISIMEAMRAGLPVIATDVSGISEEVKHGENGLLVPHADSDALQAALKTFIHSPETRRRMGEAGRQKFLQEFTLERMLGQIEAVYERAMRSSL